MKYSEFKPPRPHKLLEVHDWQEDTPRTIGRLYREGDIDSGYVLYFMLEDGAVLLSPSWIMTLVKRQLLPEEYSRPEYHRA